MKNRKRHSQLGSRPHKGTKEGAYESVRGIDIRDFIRHVQVLPMHTQKLLIKVDDPRLKNNLCGKRRVNSDSRHDASSKRRGGSQRNRLTIGAKMTSSYARSPYFSAGAPGRRTIKSYRFNATSLFVEGRPRYFVLFLIKRRPQFHRDFSGRERTGSTYLEKSRYPGFQVFHDIPVVRPRQVQVSVREPSPFEQDAQEFRDIVPPDIQENPGG